MLYLVGPDITAQFPLHYRETVWPHERGVILSRLLLSGCRLKILVVLMTGTPEPARAIRQPELAHLELKLSYLKHLNLLEPLSGKQDFSTERQNTCYYRVKPAKTVLGWLGLGRGEHWGDNGDHCTWTITKTKVKKKDCSRFLSRCDPLKHHNITQGTNSRPRSDICLSRQRQFTTFSIASHSDNNGMYGGEETQIILALYY